MLDLWNAIFTPAIFGERHQARLAISRLPRHTPPESRPRLSAISARALLVLGRSAEARSHLRAAGADEEAGILRSMMSSSVPAITARSRSPQPGVAADACCDLAWVALRRGEISQAAGCIQRSLEVCPDHGESRVWQDLLTGTRPERLRAALTPSADQGWMSWERILRRSTGNAWAPAPPSGLERLKQAGVPLPRLASSEALGALPPADPLITLELMLDRAITRHRYGQPCGVLLERLWRQGLGQPAPVLRQIARAIMDLAIVDASAGRVGLAAAEAMRLRAGECRKLEALYVRFLASQRDPQTLSLARAALQRAEAPEDWERIIDALLRIGHHREALQHTERALADPRLAAAATGLLLAWQPASAIVGSSCPDTPQPRPLASGPSRAPGSSTS